MRTSVPGGGGRSGGGRLGGHLVAELLQAADEPAADGVAVALVEVGGAEVLVGGRAGEQVVGDHQDGVPDRDGGLLRAASAGQAVVLDAQVGPAGAAGGVGGLDQDPAQGRAALPRLGAAPLAGALVAA